MRCRLSATTGLLGGLGVAARVSKRKSRAILEAGQNEVLRCIQPLHGRGERGDTWGGRADEGYHAACKEGAGLAVRRAGMGMLVRALMGKAQHCDDFVGAEKNKLCDGCCWGR